MSVPTIAPLFAVLSFGQLCSLGSRVSRPGAQLRLSEFGRIRCCFWDSPSPHLHQREQVKFEPASPWPGRPFPAESFSFWLESPRPEADSSRRRLDRRSLRLADGSGAVESGQKPAATAGRLR